MKLLQAIVAIRFMRSITLDVSEVFLHLEIILNYNTLMKTKIKNSSTVKGTLILSIIMLMLPMNLLIAQQNQKPNVLLISIDDLNDWIGYPGGLTLISSRIY